MKIIKNEIKDKKLILTVEVESTNWKKLIEKEVTKASKNVKVDGFRAGKAPLKEIKKRLNMPQILLDAATNQANIILNDVLNSKEFEEAAINAYPTPQLDIEKINEEELVLIYTFEEFPIAKVGDYKKMKVDIIIPKVEDSEVEKEIENLLSKEKMFVKKTGKLAKGDLAIFDFDGYIDDKPFPGGSAKKYELEIGSNTFIPGFEDQMVGLASGEEKDLNLSFPKDYHARDFAGKNVLFKVKLHEIKGINKPTLDDNFVKGLKINNVKTVNELRDYLKTNIFRFKTNDANEKNVMAINKGLVEITKIDQIPQIIINDEAKKIRNQLNQRLAQMQMKLEDYARMTGKTIADFDQEILEQAKNNVIVYAALDEISKKEKIEVTEKDIDAKLDELAQIYHITKEEAKKTINNELLSELLLNEKTIQKVISYYTNKK